MNERNSTLARRATILAAVFLAAAAVTAIYVISRGPGNVETAQCAPAQARQSAIAPFATGDVAAFQVADTPVPIEGLTFRDGDGASRAIEEWRGRTVLLNLWATWCAPCREEMPALEALERAMGGADFAVVAVSVDLGEADKPRQFYVETGLTDLPFFHDGSMGVFNALKKRSLAIGMPTSLLIDAEGCLLGSMSGPADWAGADARALIEAALRSRPDD
ncbi:MAG: thiol:disulfide interchange protein TlpA [Alphaproteobacteria bacterium]|nr:MAG: thiol:disulfide interchange protein TlpA [Alphaproteobacteria bacterium]